MHQPHLKISSKLNNFCFVIFTFIEIDSRDLVFCCVLIYIWYPEMTWLQVFRIFVPQGRLWYVSLCFSLSFSGLCFLSICLFYLCFLWIFRTISYDLVEICMILFKFSQKSKEARAAWSGKVTSTSCKKCTKSFCGKKVLFAITRH